MVPIAVTLLKQHCVGEIREFNGKFRELTSSLGPQAQVSLELIHMGRAIGGSRFAAHGAGTWGQATLSPVPLLQGGCQAPG